MGVKRFDHIGVVVDDLDAVLAFFLELGLEKEASGAVSGEWVDRIIGLEGARSEIVMLQLPGGGTKLELTKFHSPVDPAGPDRAPTNRHGFRHICYEVDDLDAIVERVRERGLDLVGEVVNYENVYRLCYVRGPEGLIVELAEAVTT